MQHNGQGIGKDLGTTLRGPKGINQPKGADEERGVKTAEVTLSHSLLVTEVTGSGGGGGAERTGR